MRTFLRRTFIGLAGLGGLVVLFYAEEDLRGWYAWHHFQHQWEAKGEKFDFAGVMPPPVPDDQNFAMSPVWVAEIKFVWRSNPERAKAWYGDRINDEAVSELMTRMPVGVSGLVGTNWGSRQMPATPDTPGHWTTGRASDLEPWQSYYRDLERTTPAADIPVARQLQSPAAGAFVK